MATTAEGNQKAPFSIATTRKFPVGIRICTKFNHIHRSRWYSDIFDRMHPFSCSSAYLHRCISWLMARSKVNVTEVSSIIFNIFSMMRPGIEPRSPWWLCHISALKMPICVNLINYHYVLLNCHSSSCGLCT